MTRPARPHLLRIVLSTLLASAGIVLLILAFAVFHYQNRFDGYVEVQGTVQALPGGVDPTIADSVVLVRYRIDGATHVGVLAGSYPEGTTLALAAPADGSVLQPLRLRDSTGVAVLSWFVVVAGAVATLAGLLLLYRSVRARDRVLRAEVTAEVAAVRPVFFSWWPSRPRDPEVGEGPGLSAPASYDDPRA